MTNIIHTLSETRQIFHPELERWMWAFLDSDGKEKNLAFFTLHFDRERKSIEEAKEHYRRILSSIFAQLCGKKWHTDKNLLPGITIIEHGKRRLHCHSIINLQDKTEADLVAALDYILKHDKRFNLTFRITDEFPIKNDESYRPRSNHLLIQMPIRGLQKVINYILKEYDFKRNRIDFSNFFPHELLFDKGLIQAIR